MYNNVRRRVVKSSFTHPRRTPSRIIDEIESHERRAQSDIYIQRMITPEGQRNLYAKLARALEEDKIREEEFNKREKPTKVCRDDDYRKVYHNFCEDFQKSSNIARKEFERVSKSARSRNSELAKEKSAADLLERKMYRLEMNLADPPVTPSNKPTLNRPDFSSISGARLSLAFSQESPQKK
ncbi:hypothetical protein TRFO_02226 [Tritrichomonas foetus]|uniref:Uncharacterized protein n=1 Tax=Tritrichomonas foetus TaxID=1144522 RepID=A0A1J4JCV8_9EUKA|nr:hypothetical protein TRFO_02226 [Tritrichomonas foetus]|eukprot:OHS95245.1 hypothetical protein TRFO_02226 [Tritrichomonas foetus]